MNPKLRVIRTVLQAVVAFCTALPLLSAQYGVPVQTSAKYAGPVLGLLVVASAVQNAIEAVSARKKEDQP